MEISRRKFIKGTVAIGVTLANSQLLSGCGTYNSHDLATMELGKTGVKLPRIALGLGSRFCAIEKEDEALDVLTYALDNGLYYWDTANNYQNNKLGVISEERIGNILKDRRSEVFISTKISAREPDQAMKQIEESLDRMQITQFDMLKIHGVKDVEDVDAIEKKDGVLEIVHKMKEEGVTRFIGFSGHTDPVALKHFAENYNFDSMLMALNHYNPQSGYKRQEEVLPVAHAKGMGVMLMKVIRPREKNASLQPKDLIRYALSIKEADGIVLGTDSKEVVKSNLEILKNFKPMEAAEMDKLSMRLSPFYQHDGLPWMENKYQDGNWA